MTTPEPPANSGSRTSGDFPQPTSPWESRSLLYAEIVGALGVLALVLATGMAPRVQPDSDAARAKPAVTLATAAPST